MYSHKSTLNPKMFFRFLPVILTLSILAGGCTLPQTELADAKPSLQVQEEFDDFTDELFAAGMSQSDSFSVHFSMEHPENYNVSISEPTWGEIPSDDTSKTAEEISDALKTLKDFSYDALTTEQKITYDTLLISLETAQEGSQYTDFSQLFSPMKGLQTQIPLLLSEYDFHSIQDIEDYLSLVEQSYDYVSACLEYQHKIAEKGYCLTDYSSAEVQKQCMEFLAPAENCLIPVFNEKLNTLGSLDDSQITEYKSRHEAALKDSLIPAYQLIISELSEMEGMRKDNSGLSHYKNGKQYYEYLVRSYTGSDKSVKKLISQTEKKITADIRYLSSLLAEDPQLYDALLDYQYIYSKPEDILSHLQKSIPQDFPDLLPEHYTLKEVPQSLEALSSPAFYLISPIDNLEKQVIYINNSDEYASMDLFPTLAHEGFPGHMYAGYYYNSLNPHPIRSLLGPTGYHEGWAQYGENYAYQYSGLDSNLADCLALNNVYSYALYARLDMGIHYQNWNLPKVETYLENQGLDTAQAETIYYTLVDDPAAYLPYYISYVEILELRDEAEETLKEDFSLLDFHEFFLSTGPTYFDVMKKHMKAEFLH